MDNIKNSVRKLLNCDNGHGFDHVERVTELALKFADKEHADKKIVELAALLHDVDDYKIFGEENAKNLFNANQILNENNIDDETSKKVINIIKTMGYSKYLDGIRPDTIEGKVVSDADMCDAIGAEGILRTYAYGASRGDVFFDKTLSPSKEQKLQTSATQYHDQKTKHAIQHFFDKILKIPAILMTSSGREEGNKRLSITTGFLYELFREENAIEWTKYLDQFLEKQKQGII